MDSVVVLQVVFASVLLLAFIVIPTFYGMYRAYRTERFGWLAGIFGAWLIGGGWVVGWIFLLGPDRRHRKGVRAAARGEGYHPDYGAMGT